MGSCRYAAHTRDDGAEQPLLEHLSETARLARGHASPWGGEFAYICGLAHDVGKYSPAFQERIHGGAHRVDHSTSGAQLLDSLLNHSVIGLFASYCVMGHHGGLPNGGSPGQDGEGDPTLYGRLKKRVENYEAYKSELNLPRLEPFKLEIKDGFDAAFFIRMAYSALVDADWLDTERFCQYGNAPRGGFADIGALCGALSLHTGNYLNAKGVLPPIYERRNGLLRNCLSAAKLPSGLFTLTAPTGSGKTLSSLAFALEHARANGKRRVIYVVPYNTIIEQNASVFDGLVGEGNVLRHNSGVSYDGDDDESRRKRASIENWDYPLIVTSSVQFFESLFAHNPSKCRKLHNIADSVLVFDEAQMIPVPYLIPCVRVIKSLVMSYGCTAVLATATQSALDAYFAPLTPAEITENPAELYRFLRRASIKQLKDPLTDAGLSGLLLGQKQVLCIVNTRRHAQALFETLHNIMPEGTFHLSTTMYPAHRQRVLEAIRARLGGGLPCRVISTSLVEAGVDLDFEAVYREQAGLDSIVQAAGRCNREGRRPVDASFVCVFTSSEHKPPRAIQPNIDAYVQTARDFPDPSDPEAISGYFRRLFYNLGKDRLDAKNIIPMLNSGAKSASFPFADVSAAFKLIDDSAQRTVYILFEAPQLENRVRSGERTHELFRQMGAYSVSLFEHEVGELDSLGAIEKPDRSDDGILLLTKHYYREQTGVKLSPEGGLALFS